MKTDKAKRWGGSITMSLTDFIVEGKSYDIYDAMLDGEKIVVIRPSKIPIIRSGE